MAREDFSERIKRICGERVCFICSNPDCQQITRGPHSDPDKTVNVGVAAHICAASPGGPRYDPAQTLGARRSSRNAIWLCQTCAALVDRDLKTYSREVLLDWKLRAEQFASRGGLLPSFPQMRMWTFDGRLVDQAPSDGADANARDHILQIENNGDVAYDKLRAHLFFPEVILEQVEIRHRPIGAQLQGGFPRGAVVLTGGAQLKERYQPPPCFRCFGCEIAPLAPREKLVLRLRSIPADPLTCPRFMYQLL